MLVSPEHHRNDRPITGRLDRFLALLDLVGGLLAVWLAFAARFERLIPAPPYEQVLLTYAFVSIPLRLVVFYLGGLYNRVWRFAGIVELERILLVTVGWGLFGLLLGGALLPLLGLSPFRVPVSVLALDGMLTIGLVTVPRLAMRLFNARWQEPRHSHEKRVLVIGAGAAGAAIAKELLLNRRLGLRPVGFLDDDPSKRGLRLYNLPILGSLADLVEAVGVNQVDQVIIAMPTAPGAVIRNVLNAAQMAGIEARTVPGISEILSGRVSVNLLRPVQIEDLLRREPVQIDLERLGALMADRTVLVTGAGGSIGSELCRQLIRFGPARLVLLGHGENSIFTIHSELEERWAGRGTLVPVIADIRDRTRMFEVFREYRPSVVFHAAAHKHVPLMEWNVSEAITNNVLGTRNVIDGAIEVDAEHLVLISTDKVVRPTSVMGASKRVAEQLVQDAALVHAKNCIAVRFGNVLGSRGSVVPSFLRQIEAGGPVTVTHPEMRRYFMTIPEAVQLVLQAVVIGRGGEVLVLDMGEPIKIVDLAQDLIRLSGLEVGRDIEIKFSGVRPGEKLYEEMFFGAEMAEPTEHPKVLRARHVDLPAELASMVEALVGQARAGEDEALLRGLLMQLVPDYRPAGSPSNVAAGRHERPTLPHSS